MLMLNEARLNKLSNQEIELFVQNYGIELPELPPSITQNTASIKKTTGANNYTSLANYWHPNPNTRTGFPYIRKDGIINKNSFETSDRSFFYKFIKSVIVSTLIYRVSKSEEYGLKAVEYIRHFFLIENSRMNPDLTYSGIVMGNNENHLKIRGATIDVVSLPYVVDMIEVLRTTPNWTDNDEDGMKLWFGELANWFQNSPRGILQSGYHHNIKTSYMLQLASYLSAAGKEEEARNYLEANVKEVLSKQIASDGQQPLEMERTLKMHYCNFNLTLLCNLAKVCSSLGIDIWNYVDDQKCGSIRKAMTYMATMYLNPDQWTFTDEANNKPVNSASTRSWLVDGVSVYDDQILCDVYDKVKIYEFGNVSVQAFVVPTANDLR